MYQSMLLRHVSRDDVVGDPFPHVYRKAAVDPDLYARLVREFPNFLDVPHRGSAVTARHSLDFMSPDAEPFFEKSDAWRMFRSQLLSRTFLREFVDLFHEGMLRSYPRMVARTPLLIRETRSQWTQRIYRWIRTWRDTLFIEATFNLSADGYAIGPHHDNAKKIGQGLLYLRDETDQRSEGGEFLVLRQTDGDATRRWKRMEDSVDDPALEVSQRVPYEANGFCMMMNTRQSLHAATAYTGHGFHRRFIYFDIGGYYQMFDPR